MVEAAGPTAKLELDGLGPILAATDGIGRTLSAGDKVKVSIRAEKLVLDGADLAGDDVSTFPGTVTTVDYQGQVARYFLEAGAATLQAINTIDEHPLQEGKQTAIRIRARDCVVLPH